MRPDAYGPGAYHHWHYGRGGPRRFLWFFIGAAAATLWIKHKEGRNGYSGWSNHCIRPPVYPPAPAPTPESSSWSPRQFSRAVNNIPPADSEPGEPNAPQAWNEEKERVLALSQKAGDKMTELSEATLDTVLQTVEVLKAKLAEHRAEREKRAAEEEERRKNPPHLV
ncbi:hypothetical protein Hypma_012062 [Hypsizygus marmoreus]|uniref:Peroxin-14 n=1 Tax=Hypsizygus marmoreus TaxID=39966 RepID=A0A369JQ45_HYPMA|nr:hypothetical protein Hypma_012062 [Hypsizygus marmoreus]